MTSGMFEGLRYVFWVIVIIVAVACCAIGSCATVTWQRLDLKLQAPITKGKQ